jgi:hypothetical protein
VDGCVHEKVRNQMRISIFEKLIVSAYLTLKNKVPVNVLVTMGGILRRTKRSLTQKPLYTKIMDILLMRLNSKSV